MAEQKVGKCKNLIRSARERPRNQTMRPHHIKMARERHIKNARQSCGDAFAKKLETYYQTIGIPGKRH